MSTIYTAGYSGHKLEELARIAERLNALIFDIRYKPSSRVPEWNPGPMRRRLGDHYQACQSFGNIHYKGDGPIQLADANTGLSMLSHEERPVILLCMCRELEGCHRNRVAQLIRRNGYEVEELDWSLADSPAQTTLF